MQVPIEELYHRFVLVPINGSNFILGETWHQFRGGNSEDFGFKINDILGRDNLRYIVSKL